MSDAARRLLLELVFVHEYQQFGRVDRKVRDGLIGEGLLVAEPHPTKKRGQVVRATESGYARAMELIESPFVHEVKLRPLWNALMPDIAKVLRLRGQHLLGFLEDAREVEDEQDSRKVGSTKEELLEALLALSGERGDRSVRLHQLRSRLAHVERVDFDAAVEALVEEHKAVAYPDDDRAGLKPEDHAAAFVQSGIPMHLLRRGRHA